MTETSDTATVEPMKYETVVLRVREIVAAKPDNRPSCAYFYDSGEACCVVGNLFEEELRAAGIDFNAEENSIGIAALTPTAENALNGYRKVGVELTPKARLFLATIQRSQDAGNSWASAFAYALGRTEDRDENGIIPGPVSVPRLP